MQADPLDSSLNYGMYEDVQKRSAGVLLGMMIIKTAVLGAALASAVAITAYAADPAPTPPVNPPQVATNPGLPYSPARTPGPKVGPSTWIPSPHDSATPSTGSDSGAESAGSYYTSKGFGPKPH